MRNAGAYVYTNLNFPGWRKIDGKQKVNTFIQYLQISYNYGIKGNMKDLNYFGWIMNEKGEKLKIYEKQISRISAVDTYFKNYKTLKMF